MGLMDKVKAQAAQLAQQAQDTARDTKARIDQSQAGKRGDAMLRDLGVLVFAERTGRGTDDSQAQVDKLIADLSAYETQNGINLTQRSDQQGMQGLLNSPLMSGGPAATGPGEFLPGADQQPSATFTDPGLAPPQAPGAPQPATPVFPGTGSTAFPGQATTTFPDAGTSTSFPDAAAPSSSPDPAPGSPAPETGPSTSFPAATSFPDASQPDS